MSRISNDEYFLQVAHVVAKRSTCLRHHVGAVIVKDNRILSTGYNGAPKKLRHCLDIGCQRERERIPSGTMHEKCRAVHAEQNAIIQASVYGISIENSVLYCTHQPCILCAKMIINAGIKKIIFVENYPDNDTLQYLEEAKIKFLQLNKEDL